MLTFQDFIKEAVEASVVDKRCKKTLLDFWSL